MPARAWDSPDGQVLATVLVQAGGGDAGDGKASDKAFIAKGNAFKAKGNAFKAKGNAFIAKGNAFIAKGNAFKAKGNAFKAKGNDEIPSGVPVQKKRSAKVL